MHPFEHSNQLKFKTVNSSTWNDFVQLFESRGGPKNCWCMVWRSTPHEAKNADSQSRKAAMQNRVAVGTPVGILGYLEEKPVAWCSIAPKSTYRRLPELGNESVENIWVLACFFVIRSLRGKGFTRQLIEAAITHARQNGATLIEAYPVDPDSPSYRFMGFIDTFKTMGFEEVGRAGKRRYIMRQTVK
jgi:GNAT superfamily N-acetyltransferase